jgi:signal transduction histidine kinase
MEEMRLKLLARDAQLRQMLSGVAHEIRNPLGGIEIFAGLIADDLPEGDSRKQHIRKVIAEVRNLDRVIAEFLAFARQATPDPESVLVARLAEDAAFLLSPEMERASVEYDQQIPPDLAIFADPEQIKRTLVNLMKNGVQAMAGTGGRLSVRAEPGGVWVAVEIEDTGPGIPSHVQARLFEPFFTTREKGSGLGLAIAHQAVEKNRGRIDIASEPGKGTRVTLHLPAARGAAASQLVQA